MTAEICRNCGLELWRDQINDGIDLCHACYFKINTTESPVSDEALLNNYKAKDIDGTAAWIGCLGCYNNGNLTGKWVPGLEAGDVVAAGLATVETVGDYTAPRCVQCFSDEFLVMDHERFYGFISEECAPSQAQEAAEILKEIEEEGIDPEAAGAWVRYTGQQWDLDGFQDSYQGEHNSFQDYAEELARELYGNQLDAARWPFSCIDWAHAARELSYDYFTEDSTRGTVFIFRNS